MSSVAGGRFSISNTNLNEFRNNVFFNISQLLIADNPQVQLFENITFSAVRNISISNVPINKFGEGEALDVEALKLAGCQLETFEGRRPALIALNLSKELLIQPITIYNI